MEDFINEAAVCFNIKLHNYTRAKAAYLLEAEGSPMILKKQSNVRKIEELYKTTEFLHSIGFKNAERYMTAGGKPYASIRDGFYTVSTCGGGDKCNLSDVENVSAIAATIARLHNICAGANTPDIEASKTVSGKYYEKRLSEAKHIKKWLDKRSRFSDIDVLYIKKYDEYMKNAANSSKRICGYLKGAALNLCFGEFKEDSVLMDVDKNVTLLNFENCILSAPDTDLCQLIRRFVKRGGNASLIPEIISAYGSERRLDESSIEFIKAYLSFPHKFFALTNKYYNGKKACGNSHTLVRLKSEIGYQDRILEAMSIIK